MKAIMKVYIVILTGKNARILGTYADDTETIEKLKADGYKIVTYATAPVVKVLNPDVF